MVLSVIAGGSIRGGSHATVPAGEIVVQRRTSTGAPTHTASLGTLCYGTVDDVLYVNNNGSTGWTALGVGGGASILNDLSDVTITVPANNNLLRYNGTTWVNIPDSTYATAGHTHVSTAITDFNEAAQDAVGAILLDSSEIDFTYVDAAPSIAASLIADSVVVGKLHAAQTNVFFGRDTAAAGPGEEITAAAARTILNVANGANAYVHPNHSGDVTSINDGATTIGALKVVEGMIANNAVTFAKMQTVGANVFLGNDGIGTAIEALSVATTKTMLNLAGSNTGDQTITLTGDVTGTGTGSFATTIGALKVLEGMLAPDAVTYAKLQNASAGFTIMAKAGTGAGDYAELAAGTDAVLRRDGSGNLAFGTIDSNHIAGITALVQGDIIFGSGTDTLALLIKNASATRYLSNTGTLNNPAWAQVNLTNGVTGALPIANGGTGQTGQTAAFDALSPLTTKGDIIASNGTDAVRLAVGVTDGHVLTIDATQAAGIKWAAAGGGGGASALGDLTDVTITAAALGDLLRFNGTAWVDYPDSNYAAFNHFHTSFNITDFDKAAQDAVGGILFDSPEIDFTYSNVPPFNQIRADLINNSVAVQRLTATQTDVFFGRDSLGAGGGEEITASAARLILNVADGANNYVHPNHTGDVGSNGDGLTTIAANAVAFAKMQAVSTDILLGNDGIGTTVKQIACTAFGRSLIDDLNAATARSTLELGSLSTFNSPLMPGQGGTGLTAITADRIVTGAGTAAVAITDAKYAGGILERTAPGDFVFRAATGSTTVIGNNDQGNIGIGPTTGTTPERAMVPNIDAAIRQYHIGSSAARFGEAWFFDSINMDADGNGTTGVSTWGATQNAKAWWDGIDFKISPTLLVTNGTNGLKMSAGTLSAVGTNLGITLTPSGTGSIEASSDVRLVADSRKIVFGAMSDDSIYHDGTNLFLDAATHVKITKNLRMLSDTGAIFLGAGDNAAIRYDGTVLGISSGSVAGISLSADNIFFGGAVRFQGQDGGIVSGAVTVVGTVIVLASEIGTTDTLATLTSSMPNQIVILRARAGDTITVTETGGNLNLGAATRVLSGNKVLTMISHPSGGGFDELSWADN